MTVEWPRKIWTKALASVYTTRNLGSRMKLFATESTHLVLLTTVSLACWLCPAGLEAAPAITYVQGNYAAPQAPQTLVSAVYSAGQASGDLNVVVVGWNDSTAVVSAVTDSSGNTYTLAVGPTVQSGYASQCIYYAPHIMSAAAGTNTVTVTFATAATSPDIRIFEYSGADPINPVDATAANSGNSTTSSSGSVNTTNATDLIFGANLVQTQTIGPGGGFTERLLTAPDGDIGEDQMVAAPGSYSASAPVSPSGPWIMQVIAFRTPAISYVQGNSATPQTPQTTVNVVYAAGQIAGDLNVVVVGWNDSTAVVSGVTDSSGNTYTLAVGPTVQSGFGSQSIYYAPNIASAAAGTNTVTVTFASAATSPDIRILEYSGADPINPVDATAANSGNSTTSNSGSASTTNATDLILGANLVQTQTIGPGVGFTQRLLTAPDGDIVEDQMVAAPGNYSVSSPVSPSAPWIMQMVAFRTPLGSIAPTAPGNLTAAAISASQINLGWTGSASGNGIADYVVQRCQGAGCTNFAQVATAAGTNYTDTGLLPSTSYSYQVQAADTAGNTSTFSNTATAATLALPPPTAPGNLTATAVSASQINLGWTGSASGYGIAYYVVQRCQGVGCTNFTLIATLVGTSYTDTGLLSSTSYSYQVQAVDTAGNAGAFSNVATTVTLAPPPPTAPGSLTATAVSATQINLGWTASTSSVGIANYVIQRCQGNGCTNFTLIATLVGTSYNDTGLLSSTSYSYQVQAVDAIGNAGAFSNVATAATLAPPPPAAPGNLTATAASATQINLSWTASTSSVGIANYVIQRCQGAGCTSFAQIAAQSGTTYVDTGLLASTSYSYQVQAVDTAGNAGPFSSMATAVTQAWQPPTAPGNLTAVAADPTQINLSWTASTSSAGLANYIVQRCQGADCTDFAQIATPVGTSYSDTGLLLNTSYSYQVQAIDTAGNLSPDSSVATLITGSLLPLRESPNSRYLVRQDGTPFLIMGDSPQALVGDLGLSDMATYMADREKLGFNSLWVNLLCASYTGCNSNGTTYDGVAPFTSGSSPSTYDLSTPNSDYFSRVDSMVNLALTYNLVVFLDPIETGGWLVTLENNGGAKAYNYGVYIGNRYKNFANIVWLHGNDFQSWSSNSSDNNLVQQVMAGIASVDSNHLQTIELNYDSSYSNQDSVLGSLLTLDSAYTYYETYDIVLQSYNSSPTIPTYLVESNYEYENNTGALPGNAGPYVLREQAYWTLLSGGTGQIYGNHYVWMFAAGWQSFLDSPGALEIQYVNQLFGSVPWWELVPDSAHEVVTAGYGTYDGSNQNLTTATYCTTGWIAGGSLALTYCPNAATLTVDLGQFSGPVTAQWYDPSNGTYTAVSGSPFPNSGNQDFTTPGNNHDGNPDWVLVLESIS